MRAAIKGIEFYLPEAIVSTENLAHEFPEWSVEKIEEKTGISERHIAGPAQCSSDLGVLAAEQLFASGLCKPTDVDYLLFCTQSPDYFLPTTACLMQNRLGVPTKSGALDINLGCSGFVYGLGLAKGLIETDQAASVLLITAETYSKFMNPRDKSVRTIFGDAGAATLIQGVDESTTELIGPFVYGTDGRGGDNLIVRTGGMRQPRTVESAAAGEEESGNVRSNDDLYMDGAEIFNFTLTEIPRCVTKLLEQAGESIETVDLFVFHQANRYMLEYLRKKMRIPEEKFYIGMQHCGNTVSSSIPIALKQAATGGYLKDGAAVVIVGFGVGYSWSAALARWSAEPKASLMTEPSAVVSA
jgi:3-oxoacyl-[acyl-carrier-protein] synthase-3